jgi:Domain of unknown function (DUF4377)
MNLRPLRTACLAVFICLASACGGSGDDEEVLTYEVAAYRSPCVTMVPHMCLNARQPGAVSYGPLGDGVEGFVAQWGRSYVIEVGKSNVSNPPADGSTIRYRLRRVITETPVTPGTQFTVTAWQGVPFVVLTAADAGTIGGTPFTCATAQVCTDLQALLPGNPALKMTFGYGATANALPLVLQEAVLG